MTFFEAAVQVLRQAGRALNYKKITAAAIDQDLLSHVGKEPEEMMRARLEQEALKTGDGAVIEEVRPGVYGIRAGVDVDRAGQTLAPRAPSEEDLPEPEPPVDDTDDADDDDGEDDDDDDADDDDAVDRDDSASDDAGDGGDERASSPDRQSSNAGGDDGEPRRRRRGRRGGRRREESRDSRDPEGDVAEDAPQRASGTGDAPSRSEAGRSDAGRSEGGRSDGGRSRGRGRDGGGPPRTGANVAAGNDGPGGDTLSDIAAAVVSILASGNGRPLAASVVSERLAAKGVGALGAVGNASLRGVLNQSNARRAADGWPPVFEETRPNFWALATASDSSLARSYTALERWQRQHREALTETIVSCLRSLGKPALGTVITLLLDRLGYREIRNFEGSSLTIAARAPRGLTETTVAVRVVEPGQSLDRDQVASLRGSLHHYGAAEGLFITLGGAEASAVDEVAIANLAPVSIVDAPLLAERMIAAGVGVARFAVEVGCLDDALFRELRDVD